MYNKLEDNIEATKSLRASFFKRGGNVIALAATLVYGPYIALV